MIGNRTFPSRNKTQIIKKKTKPLQMNLHFIAFLASVFIVFIMKRWRVWNFQSQQDKNQQLILH